VLVQLVVDGLHKQLMVLILHLEALLPKVVAVAAAAAMVVNLDKQAALVAVAVVMQLRTKMAVKACQVKETLVGLVVLLLAIKVAVAVLELLD
jgi:hypothetical protein